ncbi:phytoene desaturase family protein [Paraflavitalea sp. CAU 1676]|uniref:phytoene desaturase family protein n=1 Tax=Paraflavitalea sp. CAU 1676 TaxID=3032598 RepID=UPI0023DCC220|nr:phytoene desaturase family protein [Paraflavitalea sp. CAU 1676]MDF2192132.1 phytoene desaturase family protein [Paraflavitalea sp. CAU 1676]
MKIGIIGAGISGLSAAAYAAKAGHEVHVFEQHATPGGRARQFVTNNGYTFDMGPSWYWMPDVIDQFFHDFGCSRKSFYDLVPLDPQFKMIFKDGTLDMPRHYDEMKRLFETLEPGAGKRLDAFMDAAGYKYKVAMNSFINKPCHSWWEFVSPQIGASVLKLDLLTNFRKYVKRYFSHPRLIALMEFPVIFLGASPEKIPALYSLMNYGGYALGTWYPMGGFYELIRAMEQIGRRQGARFHFHHKVEEIRTKGNKIDSLTVNGEEHRFDAVIASSDYHHTETLLPPDQRNYSAIYWESKTFAPSALIYYLGCTEVLPNLQHHNLFFENDLDVHLDEIYQNKKWPTQPLFYVCCPSKTDHSVAPKDHENLFLLMPLATDLEDKEEKREQYLHQMVGRLEKLTGTNDLLQKLDYKLSYCLQDFRRDYHAYGGNAYGLANTWSQTAVRKPAIRNRKLSNLYYTGQLTVPGPGVPPSIISGKIAATEINHLKTV